jgi:SsrA-binding protein
MATKSDKPAVKTISENRKARFEYFIEDTYEAGIALTGTEVKSLRSAAINITESYASAENGGIFLINAYIPEYGKAGAHLQHVPRRPRQLLLKKKEIHKLAIAIEREGMTLIPLELYFNARGRAKLRIGVAKGKKLADKRDTAAKRDWQRDKARLLRAKG